MSFASPWLLTLLALVPVLALLWLRAERLRQARLSKLADAGLVPAVVVGVSPALRTGRRALAMLAYLLFVVAAAGPQRGGTTVLLPRKGLDVLFVIDVSRSMRARDVLPDRLERTKAEVSAFLPRLSENRVGIVAFAGTAFVQCPLTTDHEAVRMFLRALRPEVVPQGGTALAAGLEVALHALRAEAEARGSSSAKHAAGRILAVVTDGEDHDGGIEEIAKELKAEGVTVVLVGVGSTLGEPIPVVDENGNMRGYLKDRTGQTVMSRMSPETLQKVADLVGGSFIDGTQAPDFGLRELEAKVATLEKRDLDSRSQTELKDRTVFPLTAGAIALLFAIVLPERRFRRPSGAEPSGTVRT